MISIFYELPAELAYRINTDTPLQYSILNRYPISYHQPSNKAMFRDNFMEPDQLPPRNFCLLVSEILAAKLLHK